MIADKSVLVFAGTTEGRMIVEHLRRSGVRVHACVATEYGGRLIEASDLVTVSDHRLGDDGMRELMSQGFDVVVDATHPYAAVVSHKVRAACFDTGLEYLRLLRGEGMSDGGDVIRVDDVASAAEWLRGTKGNVLVTTGSKELSRFTVIDGYRDRVFARVLSLPDVVSKCASLGFEGRNLFAMQGPFDEDLNYGMLRHVDARYMVTKDSGRPGGFEEKMRAARRAGAKVILVSRPDGDEGLTYQETLRRLDEMLNIPSSERRTISLIGVGMGSPGGMTADATRAVEAADVVIGSKRVVESICPKGKDTLLAYMPKDILPFLDEHEGYVNAAILLSGDVGFHSGAKGLLEGIDRERYRVEVHAGISSVVHLCALLETPWDDAHLMSIHGRSGNVVNNVMRRRKVFTLLEGGDSVRGMCAELVAHGLDGVDVAIGMALGSDDERVVRGSPNELVDREFEGLCVAMIWNDDAHATTIGIPDDRFVRGRAPMTKSEVRALSVAKMGLAADSVVYDVGAGTGSVSVEIALVCKDGTVYAIERDSEASSLIRENASRLGAANVVVVEGVAPEAMDGLPPPTHAFIGGSSGNLQGILHSLLARNPAIRVVINTVTLETMSEAMRCIESSDLGLEEVVCVSISRSREVGRYHMMTAENPIHIIVCKGSSA